MNPAQSIYVKTSSGLGNQLFQIANGLEQAARLNVSLYCDRSVNDGLTDRKYALNMIEEDCNFVSANYPTSFWRDNVISEYHEKFEFHYDRTIVRITPGSLLSGYFQHPDYSLNSRSAVLRALSRFVVQDPLTRKIHLHVRRGDLKDNNFLRNKFGLLGIEYYVEAISYLDKLGYADHEIKIFSDSPEEVAKIFRFVFYNRKIEVHEPHQDSLLNLVDLASTSLLIGANSTYSWWAANIMEFLNGDNQIVFPNTMLKTMPQANILLSDSWKLLSPHWR